MKKKLKNQAIDLDKVVKTFKTIDVLEIADLRGKDYKRPTTPSDIAVKMFAQMKKRKSGVELRIIDASLIPEIRKKLIDEFDLLGLPFGLRTICVEKNNILKFFLTAIRWEVRDPF